MNRDYNEIIKLSKICIYPIQVIQIQIIINNTFFKEDM